MSAGISSAPLRRLHGPHRSWMFATVLAPPLLQGITWSKCSSVVEPHWRHLPRSLAATLILTSCGMARELRSPSGATSSVTPGCQSGGRYGQDGAGFPLAGGIWPPGERLNPERPDCDRTALSAGAVSDCP